MHGSPELPCTSTRYCVSPKWPTCHYCAEFTPWDSQCGKCTAAVCKSCRNKAGKCECDEVEWMRLYNNDNYREFLGADPSEPWKGSHAGERIATTPFRDRTGIADLDQFR
eukprot:3057818-Karenia_brevis.AAC.1